MIHFVCGDWLACSRIARGLNVYIRSCRTVSHYVWTGKKKVTIYTSGLLVVKMIKSCTPGDVLCAVSGDCFACRRSASRQSAHTWAYRSVSSYLRRKRKVNSVHRGLLLAIRWDWELRTTWRTLLSLWWLTPVRTVSRGTVCVYAELQNCVTLSMLQEKKEVCAYRFDGSSEERAGNAD